MCPFPVGYVYLSSNNTSPATTYGGTWSPLNESRYLRLAGAWGTGGSNTISVDQMPKHTHSFNDTTNNRTITSIVAGTTSVAFAGGGTGYAPSGAVYDAKIASTGGGSILSKLQKCVRLVQNSLAQKKVVSYA